MYQTNIWIKTNVLTTLAVGPAHNFFLTVILNIHEMTRTHTTVTRQGPRLFPCLTYLNGRKFLER